MLSAMKKYVSLLQPIPKAHAQNLPMDDNAENPGWVNMRYILTRLEVGSLGCGVALNS
jgi:hypothetical protein